MIIQWKIHEFPKSLFLIIRGFFQKFHLTFRSLTYNDFLDQSYAADVCMEPVFWFVDNFTHAIGPLFVVAVIGLTSSVVFLAYWIGLPYWWEKSPIMCVILVIVGHWLLVNVIFHYYMAVVTPAGFPPQGELITEAVSICKKCISPKPPRTHHCSVCNRCILKMDHHCPWLNNCVGHRNHRYFFLYMVYMVIGVLFIIIFGSELAYTSIMLTEIDDIDEPELEGHPVKFNKTGAIIPVTEIILMKETPSIDDEFHQLSIITPTISLWKKRAIIYMILINCGVLIALGFLAFWHYQLISKGETSIEANINKAETIRLNEIGRIYINPYNFGHRKNWKTFLGLVQGRTLFQHIILPSNHEPVGDGLTWHTVHDDDADDEWP